MAVSLRFYIFADDGLKRVGQHVVDGLYQGTDALPQYANTRQKAVHVTLRNEGGEIAEIAEMMGVYWSFDHKGSLKQDSMEQLVAATDMLPGALGSSQKNENEQVVDITQRLKRKSFHQKYRWELSKEETLLLIKDLTERVVSKPVRGTAVKKPSLTHEAKWALEEIIPLVLRIDDKIRNMSEQSLKAVVVDARERSAGGREESIWRGISDLADHYREVEARKRTGKGIWYAVVESELETGKNSATIDELEFKKCEGRAAAEEAAQELLSKHAKKFSFHRNIQVRIYSEVEWLPPIEKE